MNRKLRSRVSWFAPRTKRLFAERTTAIPMRQPFVVLAVAGVALLAARVRPMPVAGGIVAAIVALRVGSMLLRRRPYVLTSGPVTVTSGPVTDNSAGRLPKSAIGLIERQ